MAWKRSGVRFPSGPPKCHVEDPCGILFLRVDSCRTACHYVRLSHSGGKAASINGSGRGFTYGFPSGASADESKDMADVATRPVEPVSPRIFPCMEALQESGSEFAWQARCKPETIQHRIAVLRLAADCPEARRAEDGAPVAPRSDGVAYHPDREGSVHGHSLLRARGRGRHRAAFGSRVDSPNTAIADSFSGPYETELTRLCALSWPRRHGACHPLAGRLFQSSPPASSVRCSLTCWD